MKILVYLLRLLVVPKINTTQDVMSFVLTSWIIADWIISIIIEMIKFSYLRSLGGHLGASGVGNSSSSSDIWGKMNGYSEEAVEIGFILFSVLTAFSSDFESKHPLIHSITNSNLFRQFCLLLCILHAQIANSSRHKHHLFERTPILQQIH